MSKAHKTPTKPLVIEIGIPPSCLSPNKERSSHWSTKYKAKKNLRDTVANTIRALHPEYVGASWKGASIKYDFYHKVVRTRDDDNYRGMMKSARDAFGPETHGIKNVLAGAGVVVDDTVIKDTEEVGFHIDTVHQRVKITLTRKE